MQKSKFPRKADLFRARARGAILVLAAVLCGAVVADPTAALADPTATLAAPTATPAQEQKQEKEKEKKDKEKKEGGLFGGFGRITRVEKSEEKQATATAGVKGVGEGQQIGNAAVGSADRERVARMEAAKPGREEMNAFLQEGKLSTSRKGGGQ